MRPFFSTIRHVYTWGECVLKRFCKCPEGSVNRITDVGPLGCPWAGQIVWREAFAVSASRDDILNHPRLQIRLLLPLLFLLLCVLCCKVYVLPSNNTCKYTCYLISVYVVLCCYFRNLFIVAFHNLLGLKPHSQDI